MKYDEQLTGSDKCFICGTSFPRKAHQYPVQKVQGYGFGACQNCLMSNRDGWADTYEKRIIEFCKENNVKLPKRKKNGRLPVIF